VITVMQGRHLITISALAWAASAPIRSWCALRIMPTATFSLTLDETLDAEVDDASATATHSRVCPVSCVDQAHERATAVSIRSSSYMAQVRRLAVVDDTNAEGTDAILQIALTTGPGCYGAGYGYAMMPGAFTLKIKSG
jgi:hypothetical protein